MEIELEEELTHTDRSVVSALSKYRYIAALLMVSLFSLGRICAQEKDRQFANLEIAGVVVDSSGAPLANAAVALKGSEKVFVERARTDNQGKFTLRGLEAGSYSLNIEKVGFAPATKSVVVPSEDLKISLAPLNSNSAPTPAQEMQFSDTPNFTVAGVKDWTAAGGHGSDANIKTSEALAKQTRDLSEPGAEPVPAVNKEELLKKREELRKQLAKSERGDLHRKLGNLDEQLNDALSAEHEYERAVQLDPSEENYFAWGAELLLHHAVQPAMEVFSRGAAAYPHSERMMAGLGAALYANGLFEQAAERLCAASDLKPLDSAPYLFLGKMLQAAPRTFPCVEEKLSRFLYAQPENAAANYYYALAIWKRSESADRGAIAGQVEELLRKSVSADSKFSEAYLQLGIVYSTNAQTEKAISALENAVAANPNLADAHLRLAQECKKSGDSSRARIEFQKYEDLSKTESAELNQQRRAIQQFVVVFKDQSARP